MDYRLYLTAPTDAARDKFLTDHGFLVTDADTGAVSYGPGVGYYAPVSVIWQTEPVMSADGETVVTPGTKVAGSHFNIVVTPQDDAMRAVCEALNVEPGFYGAAKVVLAHGMVSIRPSSPAVVI